AGALVEKPLTVAVTDVNEAPADPVLAGGTVDENVPAGTSVGTLSSVDPDAGDVVAFSLVDGVGSADNGAFAVVGDQLTLLSPPDFEAKSSYAVRVRATDGGGLFGERAITVTVRDVNEPPTGVTLTTAGPLRDDSPAGTVVGTVSATDPDAGDTVGLQLVGTAGGPFKLVDSQLQVADPSLIDGLTNPTYTVTVRATDAGGQSIERPLTVAVVHVNRPPVNTVPAALTGYQNVPLVLAGISVADPDAAAGVLTVTLGVTTGTVTVANVAGGVGTISGNGSATVTLSGTLAQLNATLAASNGVTFNAPSGFAGLVVLTVATNDVGNTGIGGAKTDTDFVGITVLSTAQQVTSIQTAVQTLVTAGTLDFGSGNALTATLKNLGTGKSAANKVSAYLDKLAEYVRTGRLTAAQAKPLVDDGNRLKAGL
ncbi:MAG TPA: hypothetical protein VF796_30990, partial [Humisphaera sp.]